MSDLAVGFGLVLVIEGLLWALAPHLARALLEAASATPERQLRVGGWIAVCLGATIVWLIRG
ncbi:MAG TPA: DUF2065 domain-containing protein [Hyphomicrobiaceae bacterium]|nr:DUF2065 domain-containing protein [Hyphomicrobiaceae bacterium]